MMMDLADARLAFRRVALRVLNVVAPPPPIREDDQALYVEGGDVPEMFADRRGSIGESRKRGLVDALGTIGMEFVEGRTYNVPAVMFAAGQARADRQVQKLNRVRLMLLSALDGAERRASGERTAREVLARELAEWPNALLAALDAIAAAGVGAPSLDAAREEAKRIGERVIQVVALIGHGPDPDGDFARVRRWAANISGEPWIECRGCHHYALDHKMAGGCAYPAATSDEARSSMGEPTGCGCEEAGLSDVPAPTPLPEGPRRRKRRR